MAKRTSIKAALLAEQVQTATSIPAIAVAGMTTFDNALLGVLEAAIAEGNASGATLDAVRVAFAFSKDDEHVAKVRDEFYTGRLIAKCSLSECDARVQIGRKPFNFLPNVTNSDLNRTETAQRALNTARVRFSELLKECGIETARTGAGGAPKAGRAPHHNATDKPAALASGSAQEGSAKTSLKDGAISIPKAQNATDVMDMARRFEALMGEFLNGSSAAFTGDTCSIVRNALIACRAELGRAVKLASDPRLAEIEALKAKLASLGA